MNASDDNPFYTPPATPSGPQGGQDPAEGQAPVKRRRAPRKAEAAGDVAGAEQAASPTSDGAVGDAKVVASPSTGLQDVAKVPRRRAAAKVPTVSDIFGGAGDPGHPAAPEALAVAVFADAPALAIPPTRPARKRSSAAKAAADVTPSAAQLDGGAKQSARSDPEAAAGRFNDLGRDPSGDRSGDQPDDPSGNQAVPGDNAAEGESAAGTGRRSRKRRRGRRGGDRDTLGADAAPSGDGEPRPDQPERSRQRQPFVPPPQPQALDVFAQVLAGDFDEAAAQIAQDAQDADQANDANDTNDTNDTNNAHNEADLGGFDAAGLNNTDAADGTLAGAVDDQSAPDTGPQGPAKRVLAPDVDAPKLHKVLAQSGVGSRRDLEQWIADGRFTVNGQVAHTGQRISFGDRIQLDGKPVRYRVAPPPPRVLAYHKPAGEVVSHDDPQQRPTVFRRLPYLQHGKWQSVGRLDINTEGLLLFTTSGELANQLMHPRFGVEREYAVRSLGVLDLEAKTRLLDGVDIDGQRAAFKSIDDGGGEGVNHWYRVVITEGRNREVRRLFEAVGHAVSRLIRIRYGSVVLPRGLKRGVWVDLTDGDLRNLRRLASAPRQHGEGDAAQQVQAGAAQGGADGGAGGAPRNGRNGGRNDANNRNDRPARNGRDGRDGRGKNQRNVRGNGNTGGGNVGPNLGNGSANANDPAMGAVGPSGQALRHDRQNRPERGPRPDRGDRGNNRNGPQRDARGQRPERGNREVRPGRGQVSQGNYGNQADRPRPEMGEGGAIPNPLQQTFDRRAIQQARQPRREPSENGPIPNPLQQTFDKRALQRDRMQQRDMPEDGPIPDPMQQTYDKRFAQGGKGGMARRDERPDPDHIPDPMQTSVGYIGADAFRRKNAGPRGGRRTGGQAGSGPGPGAGGAGRGKGRRGGQGGGGGGRGPRGNQSR